MAMNKLAKGPGRDNNSADYAKELIAIKKIRLQYQMLLSINRQPFKNSM